jgi:thiol-disulfide isomerase/thioredoxin
MPKPVAKPSIAPGAAGSVKPLDSKRADMQLETMEPDPVWDPTAHEAAVETLAAWAEEAVFKVWGGDWCGDCRGQLPQFGAALEAAGVPDERIEHYPVEKEADGSKTGPGVEEYDITLIPTVVVEVEGEELARFVEEEPVPIAEYLARELREHGTPA